MIKKIIILSLLLITSFSYADLASNLTQLTENLANPEQAAFIRQWYPRILWSSMLSVSLLWNAILLKESINYGKDYFYFRNNHRKNKNDTQLYASYIRARNIFAIFTGFTLCNSLITLYSAYKFGSYI